MSRPRRSQAAILFTVIAIFSSAVALAGIGGVGLWEPWEVERVERIISWDGSEDSSSGSSERARSQLNLGDRLIEATASPPSSEVQIRAPNALAAITLLLLVALFGYLFFDSRAATYSTIILAGTPIFLYTARLVVWSSIPMVASIAVIGGAALIASPRFRAKASAGWGLALVSLGLFLGISSAGQFLGGLVPVAGAALGLTFVRIWRRGGAALVTYVLVLVAALWLSVSVGLEGAFEIERVRDDPTFIALLQRILHGTFPWTGLMLVGLAVLARPMNSEDDEWSPGLVMISGLAVTFACVTLWSSRFGAVPFSAIWVLALGGGVVLSKVDSDRCSHRVAAVVCGIFVLLGIRDHLLEPNIVLAALGSTDAELPQDGFNKLWTIVPGALTGLTAAIMLARGRPEMRSRLLPWLGNTFSWLLPTRKKRGVWSVLIPVVVVLAFGSGVAGLALARLFGIQLLGCLELRIWFAAGLLMPALVIIAIAIKLGWDGAFALGRWKGAFAAGLGGVLALLNAHVVIPELSQHLSTRQVVQTFERLSEGEAPLIAYRASAKAAELVGGPRAKSVASIDELVDELRRPGPRFALIQAEDLAKVDSRFRRHEKRHVPVADSSNSATLLLASKLSTDVDRNPLHLIVPEKRPAPQQEIRANFDHQIELLGIDLEGPGGRETICPADAFTLRFYWHCLKTVSGRQEIFVHIDGYGLRINGDHEPASGRYKVRRWLPGDFIVDEMHLRVPMHFRRGRYNIYVGFFRGSKRMPVVSGPASSDNRVKAGVLEVR